MFGSWDKQHCRQNFVSFYNVFCPFTTQKMHPENQNFKNKENKAWRYYHFLHVCHKWQSYDIWFLRSGVQQTEFLSFWTIFCPFILLTSRKIKILKKWNNHMEISSFYTSVPKIMIICCTVPEIQHMTDVIFIFHFGLFFALLPPLHMCTKNYDHMMYSCWDMVHDRQTGRWKKWHIEVGTPPKNPKYMYNF